MSILFELFRCFALIGIGAYGGGLVTIPLIQHELVDKMNWLSFEQMSQIIAIAQMTPGPIAVNAATFTGFKVGGFFAAATSTFAVALPSLILLFFLIPLAEIIKKYKAIHKLKVGIRIGVLSLILFAVFTYGKGAIKNWAELAFALATFFLMAFFKDKLSPIIVILLFGLIGIFVF